MSHNFAGVFKKQETTQWTVVKTSTHKRIVKRLETMPLRSNPAPPGVWKENRLHPFWIL